MKSQELFAYLFSYLLLWQPIKLAVSHGGTFWLVNRYHSLKAAVARNILITMMLS